MLRNSEKPSADHPVLHYLAKEATGRANTVWALSRRTLVLIGVQLLLLQLGTTAAETITAKPVRDSVKNSSLPEPTRPIKGARDKYQQKILFVGQLPYSTTREKLGDFFARKGIQEVKLRMLTEKKSGKFRGIAFAEFEHETDAKAALRLDYSLFGGRRIRIERTATGGRNSKDRKARIKEAKVDFDSQRKLQVLTFLDKTFQARDDREFEADDAKVLLRDSNVHESRRLDAVRLAGNETNKLTLMARKDVDEDVVAFLCTLPEALWQKASYEIARLEVSNVENKGAYAMGLIKRQLRKREKKLKLGKRVVKMVPTKLSIAATRAVSS